MYKAMKKIYSSPQATVDLIDMRQDLLAGSPTIPQGESYNGGPLAGHEFAFDEEYEDEEVW